MKHLTTGIALATLLMANAAMADGGVIKFGHDNRPIRSKTPPMPVPPSLPTALPPAPMAVSRSRSLARTSWAPPPNMSSRSATASFRLR